MRHREGPPLPHADHPLDDDEIENTFGHITDAARKAFASDPASFMLEIMEEAGPTLRPAEETRTPETAEARR